MHSNRGKVFAQVNKIIGTADVEVCPPNPQRCGLIISVNGSVGITFDNSPANITAGTQNGMYMINSPTPVILHEELVYGCLNGPIRAKAANANSAINIIEISYAKG